MPLLAALAIAGCSAAAAPAASPSAMVEASPSAMMEHSPDPSAMMVESPSAMMEESPAPSAMMEHSPSPSVAAPIASGSFHAVDGTASGTVALFHLADGSFAITFEDFSVDSAASTNVILVTNKDVKKDGDVDKATMVDLGPLTGTSGMQDFAVPASADAMTYHTVVLWDTGMGHAIAAAPLQ
jgi:hypothetical protein